MTRVYIPWWEWEDYWTGMWRKLEKEEESKFLALAVEFTGDHVRYGQAMGEVMEEWPNTMLNSLTNSSINKRAFLGHCAVQFKINCPEYITRQAWKLLTNEQRESADREAEFHVKAWRAKHEAKDKVVYQNMGEAMLS